MKQKVIIFSAPSGSGKSTLVAHAMQYFENLAFSISCTTRNLRGEEIDGKDYHFISIEKFKNNIEKEFFVEFEEVYPGKFYGTLKSEVENNWKNGKVVIFDVDVKGGVALKKYFGDQALSIFIKPPSIEELERRLLSRNTDDIAAIKTRLAKVEEELAFENQFDVVLINDDLTKAKQEILQIIENFTK
ncbi:guanylate kinase [Frigoriflavimonas asaccharolytica]|uniref:Guanylate kinase n=1 Tax=Frigoriflavimonas asaccharolytica TaxID=2735899 RepID=A0A8J8K9D8_9FLAO|nr:guanylate kinase [Frigoriflavimonas asaccharolytica]NRS92972.1 guanylate kinase [Frigoriflavimonas asaccharolytica]